MDTDVALMLAFIAGMLVGGLCAFAGIWVGSRKR